MRCLIWAAVSSKVQAEDTKDSIPSQLTAARELIERNEGWHEVGTLTIPGHTRSYIFLADASHDMPQYAQLMKLARESELDLLICRGRDRLGRTDALIAQVEEYLASYNVQVYSMSMPTRVQSPQEFASQADRASIWMRSVERAKAQDEIAELRARHQMGMKRRIKEGYHSGSLPYGYTLGEDGIAVPDSKQAEIVKLIYRWFLEGKSLSEIARELPMYAEGRTPANHSSINYILRNPFYKGDVTYGRRYSSKPHRTDNYLSAPGLHKSIIDEATWQAVQTELQVRDVMGKRLPYTFNPLSGLVVCGHCNRTMKVSAGRSNPYRYYICNRPDCRFNSFRLDKLEALVIQKIHELINQPEVVIVEIERAAEQASAGSRGEVEQLERSLRQKREALTRWSEDYELGLLARAEYYERRLTLEDEIGAIETELDEKTSAVQLDPTQVTRALSDLVGFEKKWRNPRYVKKVKALLRRGGLRITITEDQAPAITLSS